MQTTLLCIYIYIYISSSHADGTNLPGSLSLSLSLFLSLSLSLCPYCPLLSVGLLKSIQCLHKTVLGKFFLVDPHWHVLVKSPRENVTHEFVLPFPPENGISCSPYNKPCSCCFVEFCFQDLFHYTQRILEYFLSSFFSIHFVSVHVVHPCSSTNKTSAWKKFCFILSARSNFHMIERLTIAVHAFAGRILISFSVDVSLLVSYVKLCTDFRGPPFSVDKTPSRLKHMYSVLFAFRNWLMSSAACSRLCSWDSAWVGVFAKKCYVFCIVCAVFFHENISRYEGPYSWNMQFIYWKKKSIYQKHLIANKTYAHIRWTTVLKYIFFNLLRWALSSLNRKFTYLYTYIHTYVLVNV